jgi:hypothetical protein
LSGIEWRRGDFPERISLWGTRADGGHSQGVRDSRADGVILKEFKDSCGRGRVARSRSRSGAISTAIEVVEVGLLSHRAYPSFFCASLASCCPYPSSTLRASATPVCGMEGPFLSLGDMQRRSHLGLRDRLPSQVLVRRGEGRIRVVAGHEFGDADGGLGLRSSINSGLLLPPRCAFFFGSPLLSYYLLHPPSIAFYPTLEIHDIHILIPLLLQAAPSPLQPTHPPPR